MRCYLTHLECAGCAGTLDAERLWNLCPSCGKPLLARYDLQGVAASLGKSDLARRPPNLWRYRELLPVRHLERAPILGAGYTPLIRARRLGAALGLENLYVKDESLNPTGSFKARGLEVAVARARELGAKALVIPSAGNAAGAMSAAAALAGLPAHVYMPADVPPAFRVECRALGASVTLVDGLITDCARRVRQGVEAHGWFDLSTLKEPYRIEGKKTMGAHTGIFACPEGAAALAAALCLRAQGWLAPDARVVLFNTGSGLKYAHLWQ